MKIANIYEHMPKALCSLSWIEHDVQHSQHIHKERIVLIPNE